MNYAGLLPKRIVRTIQRRVSEQSATASKSRVRTCFAQRAQARDQDQTTNTILVMDNLFTSLLDGFGFFTAGMALVCAILAILAKITDYLQAKLDEWNEYNDNNKQNAEQ